MRTQGEHANSTQKGPGLLAVATVLPTAPLCHPAHRNAV
uniref:Uncharacterized protein n=1 Tax=Anguilla anguilla TaxID=7936 RepID=A0A0E9QU15_ANGAN